jgi:hypothetical protein
MHFSPREVLIPWVSPLVTVRPSPIQGMGMYAVSPIVPGDVIVRWGGTVYTQTDLDAGLVNPDSIVTVDKGLYLADPIEGPAGADYYLNHSCTPSLWMQDEITLIAIRPIAVGEEVTVDYALWETNPSWAIKPCTCGSPDCRGQVTGQDWRIPALQNRYKGHFIPLLNQWIAETKA